MAMEDNEVFRTLREELQWLGERSGFSIEEMRELIRRRCDAPNSRVADPRKLFLLQSDLEMGPTYKDYEYVAEQLKDLQERGLSHDRIEFAMNKAKCSWSIVLLRRAIHRLEHPAKRAQQAENTQQTNHSQEGA